jgi:alpha-tubulin suppressor-like RCC1 family protein
LFSAYNEFGELGIGSTPDITAIIPTRIEGALKNTRVTHIISGSDHNFAITDENVLFGWGYNFFGQVGNGSKETTVLSPSKVKFSKPTLIKSVAAGMFHTVAVTVDGHVRNF